MIRLQFQETSFTTDSKGARKLAGQIDVFDISNHRINRFECYIEEDKIYTLLDEGDLALYARQLLQVCFAAKCGKPASMWF